MYICYIDESGDTGIDSPTLVSPTQWFVLNCIIVHEGDWLDTLNEIIKLRRSLRDNYSLPPRTELKGKNFRSAKGIFRNRGIPLIQRMDIYRLIMNFQSSLPIKTFSVAVHKQQSHTRGWNPRFCAWTFVLQRLDTMCRKAKGGDKCMVFPDEGHGFFIRKCIRAMRRYHQIPQHYGPGSFSLPTARILEDPNDRKSQDSYFIQLADINAYATHRSKYIDPDSTQMMRNDIWDELKTKAGDVRLSAVNLVRGGPPGIVKYP